MHVFKLALYPAFALEWGHVEIYLWVWQNTESGLKIYVPYSGADEDSVFMSTGK